jgi:hypothetical protein
MPKAIIIRAVGLIDRRDLPELPHILKIPTVVSPLRGFDGDIKSLINILPLELVFHRIVGGLLPNGMDLRYVYWPKTWTNEWGLRVLSDWEGSVYEPDNYRNTGSIIIIQASEKKKEIEGA